MPEWNERVDKALADMRVKLRPTGSPVDDGRDQWILGILGFLAESIKEAEPTGTRPAKKMTTNIFLDDKQDDSLIVILPTGDEFKVQPTCGNWGLSIQPNKKEDSFSTWRIHSARLIYLEIEKKAKNAFGDPDFDVDEDPKKLPPPKCGHCGLERHDVKTHTEDGELKFICGSCIRERESKEKAKIFVRHPEGNIWYMEAYNSMGELRPWIGGKDDRFHKGSRPMTIREAYRPGAIARYVYEDPKDYLEGFVQASDGEEVLMGGLWRHIKDCTLVKPAPEGK